MHKLLAIPAVLLAFAVGTSAAEAKVPPLRFTIHARHDQKRCTRPIPANSSIAVWAYANGSELHSPQAGGGSMDYSGDGVLVQLSVTNGGPVCARAITWRPDARIVVAFRIL